MRPQSASQRAVQQQGRDNARTPIQWSDAPNAGFTEGTPWLKLNPNYKEINADKVLRDKNSIFYFYQNMLQFQDLNIYLFFF